jgi:hypothetical protein
VACSMSARAWVSPSRYPASCSLSPVVAAIRPWTKLTNLIT